MSEEPCPLSERELEIVRLVATGASNRQIARDLYISVNTVKVHLRNVFAKLELNSRTEVAMYAVQQGWVAVGDALPAEDEPDAAAPESAEEEPVVDEPSGRPRWLLPAAGAAVVLLILLSAVTIGSLIPLLSATTTPPSPSVPGGTAMALPARWQERAPLPTPRTGLALAVYQGQIYAIGGESASSVVGSVDRYDPQSNTWTTHAAKPTPVVDAGAALLGGRIFVPGGRTASGQVTDRMEAYDPESDTWTTAASLPVPLSAYALTAFEGHLYLFGGWDGSRFVDTTYSYDPAQDTWTTRAPMPTARGYAGAVVADARIFVVGGRDGQRDLTTNEEYVPSKDDGGEGSPWTARAPLPAGRSGAGVTVAANLIHVIGGSSQPVPVKYNVRNDSWSEFESPVSGVWRDMGVEAVDTKIYCVGGWDGSQPVADNREYQALYVIIIPIPITPIPTP